MAAAVGGDLPGLHEDHAEALDEDDCLDEVGGLEIGAGEARHTTGLTRVIQLANDDQRDDADHRAEAEDLVDEVVDRGATDERPVELGVEGLSVCLEPDDGAEEEADHDEPVSPADGPELVHSRVREELDDHLLEAREEGAPAIRGRLADPDRADHLPCAADEGVPAHEAEQHADRAQRDRQGIHTWPFVSGADSPPGISLSIVTHAKLPASNLTAVTRE